MLTIDINRQSIKALINKQLYCPSQLVTVVIPIYKTAPNAAELVSLRQCAAILKKHPITIVAPVDLNLQYYNDFFDESSIALQIIRFEKGYFANIDGYNKLLLSEVFYKSFKAYEYILIYQLDAYVFKDDLSYWCRQGYDYIGAPWMDNHIFNPEVLNKIMIDKVNASKDLYFKWLKKVQVNRFDRVGNGGLSLRKVQSFILMLILFKSSVKKWEYYEDLYWSIAAPNLNPFYKVPAKKVAMAFSIESQPRVCYQLLKVQLPFGCHAWEKYEPDFWKQFIPKDRECLDK